MKNELKMDLTSVKKRAKIGQRVIMTSIDLLKNELWVINNDCIRLDPWHSDGNMTVTIVPQ